MKNWKKIVGVAALILALAVMALAAQAASPKYKYGKVSIPGKNGSLCNSPTYIAYEKGFFAEEGLDVNLVTADFETRKIGLNNGTIPTVNGDFQFFPSIEEGLKVKVVDGLHFGCIKLLVPANSPIKSAADLKGKKIGVDEIGGTPFQVASLWLENHGVIARDNKEVTFVPYSDGNLEIAAAEKGEIDAAALWDPFGSLAEKDKGFKEIFDLGTDPIFAGKFCCFLYASEKVLKEDPGKVAAILRAYHKAQDWIHNHPEEAANIVSGKKYSSITDLNLAVNLLKSYQYPTIQTQSNGPATVQSNVLYFVKELSKIGYLKTTDPEKFAKQIYYKVKL
jgi:ABC-type nitrate/sulfonate/bicarbonate transport systems, periplasmic components